MSSMMKRAMVCNGVALLLSAGCADGGVTLIADGHVPDPDAGARDDAQPRGDARPDAAPDAWVPPDSGTDAGAQQDAGVEQDSGPPPCDEVYCADDDGDGYGDPGECVTACDPPPGYVANDDDCYDSNDDAKPGQTGYFTSHRGDGSFDYNCDGVAELWIDHWGQCPDGDTEGVRGWVRICLEATSEDGDFVCLKWNTIPGCGEWQDWSQYTSCPESTALVQQRCR